MVRAAAARVLKSAPPVAGAFAVFAIAVIWAAGLLVSRADYVPIWDGRIYADCFVQAARALPGLSALRCAEHPSQAYALLVALPQRIDPGNVALLLTTNAALFVLAGFAFYRIVRAVLPDPSLAPERLLTMAAFAVHPVLLAGVVQPGLDFGVLVFFLCTAAAALERRLWLVVLFGLALSFSKETGALLYVLLSAPYVLFVAVPRPLPRALVTALLGAGVGLWAGVVLVPGWPAGGVVGVALAVLAFLLLRPRPLPPAYSAGRLARAVLPLAPLAIPPLVYGGHLLVRALRPSGPVAGQVLWMGESGGSVLRMLLLPGFGGAAAAYCALLFVLGFLWLPSAALLTDVAAGARGFVRGLPSRVVPGVNVEALRFVAGMTAGVAYLLTRYPTFANARYLLPAYPLLLLCSVTALIRLGIRAPWRRAGLTTLVGLFAISTTTTADPISRALWGTFPVGAHRLLRTTSLTGECCGWGRDQLAYNLEFTHLATLHDEALARLKPMELERSLAASRLGSWYVVGPLDTASRRSLRSGTTRPRFLDLNRLPGQLPDSVWFLDTPNVDGRADLNLLSRYYRSGPPDTVWVRGYAMAVWPLVRHLSPKPASPHSAPALEPSARTVRARVEP
jgi:hypothetical protein